MTPIRKVEQHLAQRNVRGLISALRDRNVLVRRRAAQALGELGNADGVRHLSQAVRKDSDQYVQQWAIDALRAIGGLSAIDALTGIMFSTDRRLSALAGQALATMPDPQAAAAIHLRDLLIRNDFSALQASGETIQRPLTTLLHSDHYAAWPSAKRNEVLSIAVALGATPPAKNRRQLAESGLFVSGVHTIGDLINGLRHRSSAVRIAAADRLGTSGVRWTTRPLFGRFRQEIAAGGDLHVAAAIARAMAHLGDSRAVNYFTARLADPDTRHASAAAHALVEVGTPQAFEVLFWRVAEPAPSPGTRNIPVLLAALENSGAAAIECLRPFMDHEKASVRRLMVELVTRCSHPESVALLTQSAQDSDPEVQHAALDALAGLNIPEAAQALYQLSDLAPRAWIIRALAAMSNPSAISLLRELDPYVTTIEGILLDDRKPLKHAQVQVIQEHFFDEQSTWGWRAISGRAETDGEGIFALTLFSPDSDRPIRLKVLTPFHPSGKGGETFTADLQLESQKANQLLARIDCFFDRLFVEPKWTPAENG